MTTFWIFLAFAFGRESNGFVGIANSGNTCYLNAALQTLYANEGFRQAILSWTPSMVETSVVNGNMMDPELAIALQSAFRDLESAYSPGSTFITLKSSVLTYFNKILGGVHEANDAGAVLLAISERLSDSLIAPLQFDWESNVAFGSSTYIMMNCGQGTMDACLQSHSVSIANNSTSAVLMHARMGDDLKRRNDPLAFSEIQKFPWISGGGEVQLELSAVVVHVNGGHYAAFLKDIMGFWFWCDDANCTNTDFSRVAADRTQRFATVFTYRKIK